MLAYSLEHTKQGRCTSLEYCILRWSKRFSAAFRISGLVERVDFANVQIPASYVRIRINTSSRHPSVPFFHPQWLTFSLTVHTKSSTSKTPILPLTLFTVTHLGRSLAMRRTRLTISRCVPTVRIVPKVEWLLTGLVVEGSEPW